MSLTALILLVLKTSIALDTLGLGLGATFDDTTSLFRRPADLLRAFVSMNVVMPLFALALAMTFSLHPAVKIALVALSVSPRASVVPAQSAQSRWARRLHHWLAGCDGSFGDRRDSVNAARIS
jgi:BASS family bile acid:Na+ symporter